jgi:O-antigen/teichoic acid export membrane protein
VPLPVRSRIVRLFSAAVVDQILLSGINFLMGLILVRYTTDNDYALFVILQATFVLVTTVHSSAVAGPMAMLAPREAPEPKRRMIGSIWFSQNRARWPTLVVGVATTVVGELTGWLTKEMSLLVGIGIIAGWWTVERNYVRNMLIIYGKPRGLLAVDSVYVGILFIGVLWAAFGMRLGTTPAVWVDVTFAVAAWASNLVGDRIFSKEIGWVGAEAAPIWRRLYALGFWGLAGSTIYWLFSRSYIYILASRLDLKAVADVNVVRLLVMPSLLLTVGLQSVMTPISAGWNAEVGFEKLLRRLWGIIAVVGAGQAVYLILIWLFRDWATVSLMHKHIGNLDVLLVLWMFYTVVSLFREVLVTAVYAHARLRWLTWQIGACAIIALTLAWFGIPLWGAAAALIALAVGEIANLGGILYLLRSMLAEYRASLTPASAEGSGGEAPQKAP